MARRHHSVVDMQFEFRIEALGNSSHVNVFFARFVFIDHCANLRKVLYGCGLVVLLFVLYSASVKY